MKVERTKVMLPTILISIGIVIVAFFIVLSLLLYVWGWDNKFISATTKTFPFPAAVVGYNKFLSVSVLKKDLASIENFYEKQDFSDTGMRIDFATDDGRKRLKVKEKNLLNKKIENIVIEIQARKMEIQITPGIIRQAVERKMQEYGSNEESVQKKILDLYKWNMDDFMEKVVKPDLYRDALEKKVRESDPSFSKSKEKIILAHDELKKGTKFEEVVRKYSEGESARNNGALGWYTGDQMLPDIFKTVGTLPKGSISDIIESPIGFHIISMEDIKVENGITSYKIRQIFVRARTFAEWLNEKEKDMMIAIPLREYFWDKESQSVMFSDPKMRTFEEDMRKNSYGDPSVIF